MTMAPSARPTRGRGPRRARLALPPIQVAARGPAGVPGARRQPAAARAVKATSNAEDDAQSVAAPMARRASQPSRATERISDDRSRGDEASRAAATGWSKAP